jgi:hypothetical protein
MQRILGLKFREESIGTKINFQKLLANELQLIVSFRLNFETLGLQCFTNLK